MEASAAPALQRALDELKQQQEHLVELKSQYTGLKLLLETLPSQLSHEIMVPICGSNQVLCPGRIVNTNAVMLQLVEDSFVRRRADVCEEKVVGHRLDMVSELLKDQAHQLAELEARKELLEKEDASQTHINADGYLEIMEPIREEPAATPSRPLIQEVAPVTSSVVSERAPRTERAPHTECTPHTERAPHSAPIMGDVIERAPASDAFAVIERDTADLEEATKPKSTDTKRSLFAREFGLR